MSYLKEQYGLLKRFLYSGFGRILRWCALAMCAAIALGVVAGLLSPDIIDMVLAAFMEMVEDSGVVDQAGNLSVFALLANNWGAMLLAAAYGFIPFVFLPLVSLISNGFLIGLLLAWYHNNGVSLLLYLAGILPHGIFELPALVLSVACGVSLCINMCRIVTSSPKRLPQISLLSDLLRVIVLLVAPLTVIAAVIECYVTPVIMGLFL